MWSIRSTAAPARCGSARQRGGVTRLRVREIKYEPNVLHIGTAWRRTACSPSTALATAAVWAGTLTGGASRLQGWPLRHVYDEQRSSLEHRRIDPADAGRNELVWNAQRLERLFSRGAWRTFVVKDGLPSSDINALFEDHSGVLWIGTARGIAVFQDGQLRRAGDSAARAWRVGSRICRGSPRFAVAEHGRSRATGRSRTAAAWQRSRMATSGNTASPMGSTVSRR